MNKLKSSVMQDKPGPSIVAKRADAKRKRNKKFLFFFKMLEWILVVLKIIDSIIKLFSS